MKSVRLYVRFNGRNVVSGIMDTDRVFHKSVALRHKLYVMDAYGLDESNVRELQALGCKGILLRERDTETKFYVDFETFLEKAVSRKIGSFGFRKYLPLRYWEKRQKEQVV
ncbi:MAG: hypothetical protein AB1500_11145 [Bacillota bacterium]